MNNLQLKLGQRIQEIRRNRGITQEKLAETLGMDVTSLSKIEIGKNYPKPETLEKISEALGVEPEVLFMFKEMTSEEDYINGIVKNLNFLKDSKEKLEILYELSKRLI